MANGEIRRRCEGGRHVTQTLASLDPAPSSDDAVPWLTVVGIGDDGWEGLGPEAQVAVRGAELLVGGERHLALVPEGPADRRPWPSPMSTLVEELANMRGRRICVLASGDPLLFGVGSQFARRLGAQDMRVIPHVSTFAAVCAHMLWPQPETRLVTLCGRPVETLHRELFDRTRLVVFSAGSDTPHAVAKLLCRRGFGESRITVLEHLGGADETVRTFTPADLDGDIAFAGLNSIAIDCVAGPEAEVLATVPGLPEDAFDHDGQITKREIRAITLAHLSPRPDALLWDIGAGSGSIGIEWMRAAPGARAIALEPRDDRAARARANAANLGVPKLTVIQGEAPDALSGLEAPDAIFVGGGLTAAGMVDQCWEALGPGGRMVANAVTLETEAVLLEAHRRLGGDLTRLSVSRADPVGRFTGWRPAMPVTQWAIVKPWETDAKS